MTERYCRSCDDMTSHKAGPTRGDLTCRRCGAVKEHAAFGGGI